MAAAGIFRSARERSSGAVKRPVEYSILYTATLCTLAVGAVMVYSASSAESLLGTGDPLTYLKRYVLFGLVGVAALLFLSRHGLSLVRRATPMLLGASFVLTMAVSVPGLGVEVNGARRWLAAGPLQFQPSELLKLALVLYAVHILALRPKSVRAMGTLARPLLLVVGAACALLMTQPDMGTALVVCGSIGALLIAAGTPIRLIGTMFACVAGLALALAAIAPYRMARLTAFIDPFSDAGDTGFQAVQALTAIGSGGLFGVGLGESVQKIFYLPEAHTDMILAIIGEELGLAGIVGVAGLYGLIGYAGLRTAKAARDRYSKLLAAGLTSLILFQASLNLFAVLGLAPLTGVPLPFISYGSTNLIVLMAAMGLLLNVAATGGVSAKAAKPRSNRAQPAEPAASPKLWAIDGGRGGQSRDSRGRNGGARSARSGRGGRAAG